MLSFKVTHKLWHNLHKQTEGVHILCSYITLYFGAFSFYCKPIKKSRYVQLQIDRTTHTATNLWNGLGMCRCQCVLHITLLGTHLSSKISHFILFPDDPNILFSHFGPTIFKHQRTLNWNKFWTSLNQINYH